MRDVCKIYPFFENLNENEQFRWLMLFQEQSYCNSFITYINQCYIERTKYLESANKLNNNKRKGEPLYRAKNKTKRIRLK